MIQTTEECTQATCGCNENGECPCENCPCESCPCENCEEQCGSKCDCDEGDCCYTESSNEFDDEHNTILRGKWVYDGSESIDDMIECLQREIKLLTDLKKDGWYVTHKVNDDYAFIRRDVTDTVETEEIAASEDVNTGS